MRLESDFFELLKATAEGRLKDVQVSWNKGTSMCVVLASGGYPGPYKKGIPIKGLDALKNKKDVVVFHAGTSLKNGEVVTSGGRVLGVTALGEDIKSAKNNAYRTIEKLSFDGTTSRTFGE